MRILGCVVLLWLIGHNFLQSENYIKYHRSVFEAEKHIVCKDYQQAMAIYEEVFAQLPHAFYRDLHNAAVCYLKLGDFEKGYELINQLVLHGYELIDFDSGFGSFDILKTNKIYWQRFLKQYPSLRASFLKSRPEALLQEYYQLYLSDQDAASGWDINFQDSVFYSQADDLFRLVDLHGFLPIDVNKDTIRTPVFIQFRHLGGLLNRYENDPETFDDAFFSEMESYTIKFDSLLLHALQSGKILPQTYADIVSYWASPNPYGDVAMKIDLIAETVGFKINLTLAQIEEVNEKRSEIGLYPFSLMSDGIFQSTWYRHYPFKEMKKAYLNCDSCATSLDYHRVRIALEKKVKDQFSKEERKEFILTDVAFIRDIWLYGFDEFQINLN